MSACDDTRLPDAGGGGGDGVEVKEQVRMVVGDLESVLGELRSVVGDLKTLVTQIDQVTSRIDARYGCTDFHRCGHARLPSSSPEGVVVDHQPRPVIRCPIPHVPLHCSKPHRGCQLVRSASSHEHPSTFCGGWDQYILPPSGRASQRSSTTSGSLPDKRPLPRSSIPTPVSSAAKKSVSTSTAEDSNNNIRKKQLYKGSSSSKSKSSSSASISSESSGSYSLGNSADSLDFQYDPGYDPWRKLSLNGEDIFVRGNNISSKSNAYYEQTRVVKKAKCRSSQLVTPNMAYSISPSQSSNNSNKKISQSLDEKVELKANKCSGHLEQCSCSPASSNPSEDYCGVYEKALDERLELEFDDDLDIFETIENGIHGTTAEVDPRHACNASYNRDINTWRQYSGVSMDTVSDDLWSESNCSETNSEDFLNDNFLIPLLSKTRQSTPSSGMDYHWRTVIEP